MLAFKPVATTPGAAHSIADASFNVVVTPSGLDQFAEVIADRVVATLLTELGYVPQHDAGPGVSPQKALLKLPEAADYLGISVRQLTLLEARGQIPGVDIGLGEKKRSIRFRVADLDEFAEQKARQETNGGRKWQASRTQ